jgi:hypothetical protein
MRTQQPLFSTWVARPGQVLCAVILLGAQFGCGGKSPAPQAPTSVVTTRSIAVTVPTAMLAIGAVQQASATATMNDGSTRVISTGFRSDVPTVATVTDGGTVTAVGVGRANIYVVSDGQQGTVSLQVTPSFAGVWSGSYFVGSCSQTGDFAAVDLCSTFSPNRVLPYDMILSQKDGVVTGDFYLGAVPFIGASGTLDSAGQLVLPGTFAEDTLTATCTWTLTSPSLGRIEGGVRLTLRASDASGEMVMTGTVRDSMKTARGARTTDAGVADAVRRWLKRSRR